MGMSPMMQQYLTYKEQYKDSILFFRLGDFYEMFFDDAKKVSAELELTLTARDCGDGERAPMCGVPYHAAENYISRLIAKGHKVVICEQTEDPKKAKGIVKRDIVRIVTPGTVVGNNLPSEARNNYVCSVCLFEGGISLCFADITTGDIYLTAKNGSDFVKAAENELSIYNPAEVITNFSLVDNKELKYFFSERTNAFINENQPERFEPAGAESLISRLPEPPDRDEMLLFPHLTEALGAVLSYVEETQKTEFSYIKKPHIMKTGGFLEIDMNSRRNLELCESMRGGKKGSLLEILDKTSTAMGARELRKWVEMPLLNQNEIVRRQGAVEVFGKELMLRDGLRETLSSICDIERLAGRIVYGTAGARDLRSLSNAIANIPAVKEILTGTGCEYLESIRTGLDDLREVRELIDSSITDEPPFTVREGGFIRAGYNEEVDRLNEIMSGGHGVIGDIEKRERERTGIQKLKVGYNKVFGYYIEIPKRAAENLETPEDYVRKQTLTTGERFITEELKELEQTVLGAKDRRSELEYSLFLDICAKLTLPACLRAIEKDASLLAQLDALLSLGIVASERRYVRPEVDYSDVIDIKAGRHPVVEKYVKDSVFVPNDTLLGVGGERIMLITGPNMAGKSTYMRQVALITVMAQIGSFVPADSARIGICDKIFTRVGASDDLASGTSTFMLEMNEVSYILATATSRSLIIYDEIGRGTSTFDGMSIARAVLEYTAGKKIGSKTLFATHYHELTDAEGSVPGVVNYNVAAKKRNDDIIFLRKIVRGATDDSYGIEVAKLAGVPSAVVKRAKEILRALELKKKTAESLEIPAEEETAGNMTIEDLSSGELAEKLRNTDIDTLTPIEALNLLYELKRML